jgi:dTDP-4-dehydrorhamnose reductase
MKIVVLGAQGQLGRDLVGRLPGSVLGLARADADLTDPERLRQTLQDAKPDVVVNCAAYNHVDRAEDEPEAAFRINAWGVRDLAAICRDLSLFLVHYSTDYVYGLDESRDTPWNESDAPGPVSVYGLSKLTSEYLVRSVCPGHLVLRTCGLFGLHGIGGKGTNFVEAMLRRAREGTPVRVVADQTCSPSYTMDVADATAALLRAGASGLFHVVNADGCSWYDLAREIFAVAGLTVNVVPISSREYGARARRPRYSVLGSQGLAAVGVPALRSWREALRAYLAERTAQLARVEVPAGGA